MNTRSETVSSVAGIFGRSATPARWYRAVGLSGMNSLLRLTLSFVSIKFTAIYLGPTGLALVAQLSNFIYLVHGLMGYGIGSATSRVCPEFKNDEAGRKRFLATSWRLASVFALVAIVVIALASGPLAQWLLTSEAHRPAVMLGGVAVACMVLNVAIIAAMNAVGEMGRCVASNMIAAVVGFAVYVPASIVWGLPGGLIGYAVSQTVSLPISLLILRGSSILAPEDFRGKFDSKQAQRIRGFLPMLIANSVMSPLGLILIRNLVASDLDWTTAGLWQATWRLSETYLGVVMASLSLYFLPRLGEVVGTPALRQEILATFARTVGLTAAAALTLFFARDWVVHIVFTKEFMPVRDLMPFQLLGDVMKMAAWTLGFVFVALVRSNWYIALEILIPAIYFGAALVLVPEFGARGVTWAYCLSAATHLTVSVFALRDVLFQGFDGRHVQTA